MNYNLKVNLFNFVCKHSHSSFTSPSTALLVISNRTSKAVQKSSAVKEGFTLIELLVIITIVGILSAIAAPSLLFANKPLQNATNIVAGNFKQARAKAMSTTSAFRIKAVSATEIKAEYSKKCADSAGWVTDSDFGVNFIENKEMKLKNIALVTPTTVGTDTAAAASGWDICYSSRGVANKYLNITLKNNETGETKKIEVYPGGSVEIK